MTSIEKELEHYKRLFGTGDIASRAYMAVVKQLEQQVEFLDSFNLRSHIEEVAKESPIYDRAQKMFKEMPEIIASLKELKDKLGIEYVEKTEKIRATSPQSIGLLKQSNG